MQDGKPYIQSIEAGPTVNDSNLDYNFVAATVFKNMEDCQYYENECAAHKSLKAKAMKDLELQGIAAIRFTSAFSSGNS